MADWPSGSMRGQTPGADTIAIPATDRAAGIMTPEIAAEPVLQLDRVGLRYPGKPELLSDLSLSLAAGAFCYLTGETGAGKSSLLKLLYLGHKPTRGVVRLFGHDVTRFSRKNLPLIRRKIGVVFQDFRLIGELTVFQNAALPLRIERRPEPEIRRHVEELLSWVGLGDVAEAYPESLSGGGKQRLAIARAVINRPSLLIADEPTGHVDERLAGRLMRLFEELNRLGTTIVIATHNASLTRQFPQRMVTLRHGQLRAVEPAREATSRITASPLTEPNAPPGWAEAEMARRAVQ